MAIDFRSQLFAIQEVSQIGSARRAAAQMAQELEFDETAMGRVGILINESASNVLKHAHRGEILLRGMVSAHSATLEIVVIDSGGGITDLPKALSDGFSTAGTRGTGLGALQRLADVFEIYSERGRGTVILMQVVGRGHRKNIAGATKSLICGGVAVPLQSETISGDSWAHCESATGLRLILADGLGHGPHAAAAARAAIETFWENSDRPLTELLQSIHGACRSTRGAAVSICEIDRIQRTVRFAGVGNVAGQFCPTRGEQNGKHFVSSNGTLGVQAKRVVQFEYPWKDDDLIVLYSDGIKSQWNLEGYLGLRSKHPSLIAAILYRDFRRGNDDTTVVVAGER